MTSEIIVAILAFLGTAFGSVMGVLSANKLMSYRIDQLEKKVEKHNQLIERVYEIEKHMTVVDNELNNLMHA